MLSLAFEPRTSLVGEPCAAACKASVVIPARNEEHGLARTLDALAGQVDVAGRQLPPESFEVILLLNNCTDASEAAAHAWRANHPHFRLHVAVCQFNGAEAHVGSARRWLMDTAWHRLSDRADGTAILTSDSDTVVAPDWIAQNLAALAGGADAVGGAIHLTREEISALPPSARIGYLRDRRYQRLVAKLEDRLDPQHGDPWPRHLQHFGASLACTPAIYSRCGGLPAIKPLEDVAFVDRLRRVGARLRHEPQVKVYTSSRLDGRAEVGLSGQLKLWEDMAGNAASHTVTSAAFLQHHFQTLRKLRMFYVSPEQTDPADFRNIRDRLLKTRESVTAEGFLEAVDCNRVVAESFAGSREQPIIPAMRALQMLLT